MNFTYYVPKSFDFNSIEGVETWNISKRERCYISMFEEFAAKSTTHLNLQKWSENASLQGIHKMFAAGTFFQIKEPKWEN